MTGDEEIRDTGWRDLPAHPLWRTIVPDDEGGVRVFVLGDNGVWRQIGSASAAQFEAFGVLYAEAPQPEEVSGGSPAYVRRDITWSGPNGDVRTDTFTFDPSVTSVSADWVGPSGCGCGECVDPTGPVTYLEETPDGDIVERISHALDNWERWGDAMRWYPR